LKLKETKSPGGVRLDKLVQEWLSEYKNETTKTITNRRFTKFLSFIDKTPEQIIKLSSKEAKHLILQTQKKMLEAKNKKGERTLKNNSILAYISSAKSFLEYYEVAIKFKRGQLVKSQKALGYHDFSNGDLSRIFQVANVQYKALLAVATSTGFAMDDLLALDKERIKAEIKRAREGEEKRDFIFYDSVRKKTNARALTVLNPLAIKWLSKWIIQNPKPTLFSVKDSAVAIMFKKLALRSGITLTGKIRFHKLRSWVINSLIKAGFQTEQWKSLVGKSIALSDDTYLSLKEQIIEKYHHSKQ